MENQSSWGRCHEGEGEVVMYASLLTISGVGLPLVLLAICSLVSMIRADHVAPVYVINLLTSDLLQLCSIAVPVLTERRSLCKAFDQAREYGVMVNICFMVIISLERYLCVAFPLWYRFRRSVRSSLLVSAVTWLSCLSLFLVDQTCVRSDVPAVLFLLLPLPLLLFFLCGTLRALSASRGVPAEERRRIVAVLVLVPLTYALLFLPDVLLLTSPPADWRLRAAAHLLFYSSPLADLFLYILMRKGVGDRILLLACGRIISDSDP